MSDVSLLAEMPIGMFFVGTMVLVLAAIQAGLQLARWRKHEREEGAIGAVVGATLGLLALMLAFTFGIAGNRLETRRELLLDEVNAIGTTFLRTDLIPEPHRSESRALLRQYVDLRLDAYRNPEKLPALLKESERLQTQLWQHAIAVGRDPELRDSEFAALYVDSLNNMIDMQTKRVTVGRYRLPSIVWAVLCILAAISMVAVGYHFGQSGKGNLLVHLMLAFSFSIVVFMIADLDCATEGWLRVSNQPMEELREQMR